ncbi:M20/M25/M40 family metallo-hydrolase [Bacillus sp. 1P06AnD]|uniref:M20/M25/M40 family metallo-hydrolase n=1 Tax=Bacillus sp. 1P06AnD TaxID=3132208 RepID=UPI0039A3BE60
MYLQKYGTAEELQNLLKTLVAIPSISQSEGEKIFPVVVQGLLKEWDYFKEHPGQVHLGDAAGDTKFLSAFYQSHESAKTIVCISHFDVVSVEEFGEFEQLAFDVDGLSKAFTEHAHRFKETIKEDILSGEYLFGRGSMDMKAGLTIQMGLLEKAILEKWPVNIVLLTVPDEEVNSAGMRAAVDHLVELQETHKLDFLCFLNSEPVFPQTPDDTNYYIYSGSIGKIMPCALCYGKETHVGEPLAGMTSNYMASFVTNQIEFNPAFTESNNGEKTPLPVSLFQKDLKYEYSVQTPYRSASLYNVFLFERSAEEIFSIFEAEVNEAANRLNTHYQHICERENVSGIGHVKVMRYEELERHAAAKHGTETILAWKEEVAARADLDDREKSIRMTDRLMLNCQEIGPSIVIFFAPPYYPAVASEQTEVFRDWVHSIKEEASSEFGLNVQEIRYFNGISDLSYVAYEDKTGMGWKAYEQNTPVFGLTYTIPFKNMSKLQAPVINIGPFGKDPHKVSERLNKRSAFIETPYLIEKYIKKAVLEPLSCE